LAGQMELRGIADIGIKGFIYLAFFLFVMSGIFGEIELTK